MSGHKHDFRTVRMIAARRQIKQRCVCGKQRSIPAQLCGACLGKGRNLRDARGVVVGWCRTCDGYGYVPGASECSPDACCACCCPHCGRPYEQRCEPCRESDGQLFHVCQKPSAEQMLMEMERREAQLTEPPEKVATPSPEGRARAAGLEV